MLKHIRYIFLPLLVVLIIFVGTCLLGADNVPDMPTGIAWDKAAHFGMFFVLSAVSLFCYYRLHNGKPKMMCWIFWGFIVPVIYGGVIELLQKHVFTSRGAEWGDFTANILGSLVGSIVVIVYLRKYRKNQA
jgi:VanZ family protein